MILIVYSVIKLHLLLPGFLSMYLAAATKCCLILDWEYHIIPERVLL